ncbi:hypothetical protein A2U01_0073252, partial [Trifolium medium]|nr:hypothetical protein [Trifolium medium]
QSRVIPAGSRCRGAERYLTGMGTVEAEQLSFSAATGSSGRGSQSRVRTGFLS